MLNIQQSNLKQYENLELLAKQQVEGLITGLHQSPFHGFSVEFAEHKIYNTGESTRHVDWKLFARTDRLYTKRYQEETNLQAMLLLDVSSSMYYPATTKGKIKFAALLSACLITIFQKQRDAFGLTAFQENLVSSTSIKSTKGHANQIFESLESYSDSNKIAPNGTSASNIASSIHLLAERLKRRSVLIVLSDMINSESDEALFNAFQHAKHNKHEVMVFYITDKNTELEFNFADRPTDFHDLETGKHIKLNPAQVKDNYIAQAHKRFTDLGTKCAQYKIDFIEADINGGVNAILLPYIAKRQKMAR